jgi:predicted acyl esterase
LTEREFMLIAESLPFEIRMSDDVRIPMPDGIDLVARIWRPLESDANPVPAILEFVPYRRREELRNAML